MLERRTQRSNAAEFVDVLFRDNANELVHYFARRTFDAQVAFDLAAETFALALEQQASCRASTRRGRRSWLFGIAHNLLAGFYRDGNVERRAVARLAIDIPTLSEESIERVEQLADLAAARRLMADAMARLSDQHREALRLRVVEERSYADVAAELGTTEQTARARVSRALSSLRDVLGDESDTLKEALDNV